MLFSWPTNIQSKQLHHSGFQIHLSVVWFYLVFWDRLSAFTSWVLGLYIWPRHSTLFFGLVDFYYFYVFGFFGDRVSLCSSDWSQTHSNAASNSPGHKSHHRHKPYAQLVGFLLSLSKDHEADRASSLLTSYTDSPKPHGSRDQRYRWLPGLPWVRGMWHTYNLMENRAHSDPLSCFQSLLLSRPLGHLVPKHSKSTKAPEHLTRKGNMNMQKWLSYIYILQNVLTWNLS